MPPCSWRPSPASNRWQSPAADFAIDTASGAHRIVLGDRQGRVVADGGGSLDRQEQVGEAVLEGLERPDDPVVLDPHLGVVEGDLEDLATRPDRGQRAIATVACCRARSIASAPTAASGASSTRSASTRTPPSATSASGRVGSRGRAGG